MVGAFVLFLVVMAFALIGCIAVSVWLMWKIVFDPRSPWHDR